LKLVWKSVLTLTFLLTASAPLFAQNYPNPTKVGTPATVCTGCKGTNSAGQPNDGKPTYQYAAPLSAFVGRYNDSNVTQSVQNRGMRTLRAGKVRVASTQRGTAPPRVYMAQGETFAAYSVDSFFGTRLGSPLTAVNQIEAPNGNFRWGGRNPFETVLLFDAYFYPESSSSHWETPLADNQERLLDWDWDDRGYVYVAEDEFGWGIIKDTGETGVGQFSSVSQKLIDPYVGAPATLFTLKSGTSYYTFVCDDRGTSPLSKWNTTNPANPISEGVRKGKDVSVTAWAKDDNARVVAIVNQNHVLQLFDYDTYIAGGSAILTVNPLADRTFRDMAFDEKGTLWAVEAALSANPGPNVIHRIARSGSSYVPSVITAPYPGNFGPMSMHAANGYLVVAGWGADFINDVHLFKMEGDGLRLLDTGGFFRKFYHSGPSGYSEPGIYTDTPQTDVQLFKHGTKTYLFYSAFGLGDVWQLEGSGPSVSATMNTTSFGTLNVNAQPTQSGPFPGDPITFRATTNSPTAQSVDWNFGNPEAGGPVNIRSTNTGVDIIHQYTGLNTAAKVTAAKSVTVAFTSDTSVSDALSVLLKVPTARIALQATGELITGSDFKVVYGDKFLDASDGSVEGHVSNWAIGAVTTKLNPNESISVGSALGPQTVAFSGFYGKHDAAFAVTNPYVAELTAKTYTVLPFLAKIKQAVRTGSTITYGATTRFTADHLFLSATEWTYKWSLTTAGGTETASKTGTVPVGLTVPDFAFDKALLQAANGGKVTLQITVAPGLVPNASFATFSTSSDVVVPAPVIELTNCGNAGNTCSIQATSTIPGAAATWQLSWEVTHNGSVIKTGTGNPLAGFKLTEAGSYSVTVTETVFDISVTKPFTVAATLCGPPPTIAQLSISATCTSQCSANQAITFTASPFGYQIQDCDEFVWNFGDGSATQTGKVQTHSFTSSKTYTVKLTAKNSSDQTGTTVEQTVQVGGVVVDPPTCAAPSGITLSANCISGSTCKAGTPILFTGHRGLGSLLTCDSASWTFGDGGSSSSKQPSKTYTNAGTYNVQITVTNSSGSLSYSEPFVILAGTGVETCAGSASEANVSLSFSAPSGCSDANSTNCTAGESVTFNASFFGYTQQACDRFEWNFGDGSALGSTKLAPHQYAANGVYNVALRVYNSSNPTGVTLHDTVTVGPTVPLKPLPQLSFAGFPATGSKDSPVTFTVNSNISATAWSWDFGDGVKDTTSQASLIGTTASIQHTYTRSGTFVVLVKARNAEDVVTAPLGQALANTPGIVITDVPEYKFLLPVVTHGPGQGGSVWHTDVQIYNPDPSVSPQNPMNMTASLRDIVRPLVVFNSTFTYEDFMKVFTNGNDSGPVIITVRSKFLPQIWTRTYNQTETGTFGQFIPAIRIDAAAGGGSAFGEGKYYLAGLRHDAQFRTNLGFVNPNAQTVNATVKVYDDRQLQVGQFSLQLAPYEFSQFPIASDQGVKNLSPDHPFSLDIEVPQGQWLIAYASFIDSASNDPVYMPAVRESELTLPDYRNGVIPGVGHVGEWRSDITIYNPDTQSVVVDLAYYDQTGAKVAETKNVLIHQREFLQYKDFLKQGVLGNVADSIGMLRVTVPDTVPAARFPLTFARTYNDKGNGKTFGQGIAGFAAARANVKPGHPALVAGVRSNSKYYTNVGITNVSGVVARAFVKLLDPTTGAEQLLQTIDLQPNQSVVGRVELGTLETGSLKVEVTGGNVWAFASIVDKGTADPEYVAATPLVP
jgi:PKD repeat protein